MLATAPAAKSAATLHSLPAITWVPVKEASQLLHSAQQAEDRLKAAEAADKGREGRVYRQLRDSTNDGKIFVAFMRAFCSEEDRLIPVVKPHRRPAGLSTEVDLSTVPASTLAHAINPALVSRELLDSVGITYETDPRKLPVVTTGLVRQLRVLFNGLVPVPGADGRIFVIGAGEKIFEQAGILNPELTGSILYLRSDPSGRYVLMHFPDLPSALRKTWHQLRHENQEIVDLANLQGDARAIVTKLGEWSRLESVQRREVIREATEIARRADQALGATRVEEKSRAAANLVTSAGLKDRTGRVNPPASKARYDWAAQRLAQRQKEIGAIGAYNRKDQVAILDTLLQNDQKFSRAEQRLKGHLVSVANHAMFKDPSEAKRIQQTSNFLVSLEIDPQTLGSIITRPGVTFRDRIEQRKTDLEFAAQQKNSDRGLLAVRALYGVTRMAGMQQKLDLARLDIVNGIDGIPEALAQIGRLREDFEALREMRPSPLKIYSETFAGFAIALHHAEKVLRLRNVAPGKHLKLIKEKFDKLDIEQRLLKSGEL